MIADSINFLPDKIGKTVGNPEEIPPFKDVTNESSSSGASDDESPVSSVSRRLRKRTNTETEERVEKKGKEPIKKQDTFRPKVN